MASIDPFDGSVLDATLAEIRKEMNRYADELATGSMPQNPGEAAMVVQHIRGVIHGLAMAERVILDFKEAAEKQA